MCPRFSGIDLISDSQKYTCTGQACPTISELQILKDKVGPCYV